MPLIQGEPRWPRGELGIPRVREPILQPNNVAVERHGRVEIGDVEDHMAQARHGANRRTSQRDRALMEYFPVPVSTFQWRTCAQYLPGTRLRRIRALTP